MAIEFVKYHGLGNDFILVDNRHSRQPLVTPEQAIKMCDRHFGIGADGVIFALPRQEDTDYTMRIYNSDGSEPQMCGNGIRCLAEFIASLELLEGKLSPEAVVGKQYRIHTLAGVITPEMQGNGQVKVDMGMPELIAAKIPTNLGEPEGKVINESLEVAGKTWSVTCVSMGNPHCIIFADNVADIPLEVIGPKFEHHEVFPERINTEFIEIVKPDYLKMRVWERGAGITLACGTGACATVVAGVLTYNSERNCTVELPGGCLQIEWSSEDNRVYMTGPTEKVFTGQW